MFQQQQQQQITLQMLQPLHHKDTGQQGVALLASLSVIISFVQLSRVLDFKSKKKTMYCK
jgi:hypothetical protein